MNCRLHNILPIHRPAAAAVAVSLLAPLAGDVAAEEVFFDTISTEKATRLHGAYFGAFGGGSAYRDGKYRQGLSDMGFSSDEESGWFAGVEFGYSWQTPWIIRPSVELEFTYLSNALDASGTGGTTMRADLNTGIVMLNGILALDLSRYSADVGDFWASFHPYVGVGIGAGFNKVDNVAFKAPGARSLSVDTSWNTSFAYQWMAGLEVAVTDSVSIYGEYRRVTLDDVGGGAIESPDFDLWALGFKVQY